jgi:hypothetical protein
VQAAAADGRPRAMGRPVAPTARLVVVGMPLCVIVSAELSLAAGGEELAWTGDAWRAKRTAARRSANREAACR